jgi:phosphate transport system substrate-binding protein
MNRALAVTLLILLWLGVAVCLLSCGETPPPRSPDVEPPKTVRVSGAYALYPLMLRWAEEYQRLDPEVQVGVWAGGAGKGVIDALDGVVDIGMVSRDIYSEEQTQGAFWVPVAKDAVVPVANANSPVAQILIRRGLTRDQCAALWFGGTDVTWGSLVSRPEATEPVNLYTRSDMCGAAEVWAQYLGRRQEDLLGTRVYGDPRMIEAVQGDRLGLGFSNLRHAYDADTDRPAAGLIVVPLDIDGDGTITQAESLYETHTDMTRAIAAEVYPSPPARDLYLLTKGKPEGVTQEFVLWVLTDGQKYVAEAGYVELTQPKLNAAIEKVR